MIEEGTFGVCKECGDLINAERLEEVPHTTSCFDCKNASKRH
jgi:RNA polymerase-binding transcription factor DksA